MLRCQRAASAKECLCSPRVNYLQHAEYLLLVLVIKWLDQLNDKRLLGFNVDELVEERVHERIAAIDPQAVCHRLAHQPDVRPKVLNQVVWAEPEEVAALLVHDVDECFGNIEVFLQDIFALCDQICKCIALVEPHGGFQKVAQRILERQPFIVVEGILQNRLRYLRQNLYDPLIVLGEIGTCTRGFVYRLQNTLSQKGNKKNVFKR